MTPPPQHPTLEAFLAEEAWLHRLARQLVLDEASARDLVQETWVATMENPPADASRPRAWLSTVARRIASKQRSRRRPAMTDELDHFLTESAPPEFRAVQQESAEQLRRALEDLPESHRQVVRLRFLEGMRMAEIANRTGRTERTVRNWINSAKDQVRSSLGRDMEADDLGNSWAVVLAPLLIPADLVPVGFGPGCTEPATSAASTAAKPAAASSAATATLWGTLAAAGTITAMVLLVDLQGEATPAASVPAQGSNEPQHGSILPPSTGLDPGGVDSTRTPADRDDSAKDEGLTKQQPVEAEDQEEPVLLALPVRGTFVVDGASPSGFEVTARGKRDHQHLVHGRIEPAPVGPDGRFEILLPASGTFSLNVLEDLTSDETVELGRRHGSPTYTMTVVRGDGPEVPELPLNVHTGDLVVTGAGDAHAIGLTFPGAGWTYNSVNPSAGAEQATFFLVPEGDITVKVQALEIGSPDQTFEVRIERGRTLYLDFGAALRGDTTGQYQDTRVQIPDSEARSRPVEDPEQRATDDNARPDERDH